MAIEYGSTLTVPHMLFGSGACERRCLPFLCSRARVVLVRVPKIVAGHSYFESSDCAEVGIIVADTAEHVGGNARDKQDLWKRMQEYTEGASCPLRRVPLRCRGGRRGRGQQVAPRKRDALVVGRLSILLVSYSRKLYLARHILCSSLSTASPFLSPVYISRQYPAHTTSNATTTSPSTFGPTHRALFTTPRI